MILLGGGIAASRWGRSARIRMRSARSGGGGGGGGRGNEVGQVMSRIISCCAEEERPPDPLDEALRDACRSVEPLACSRNRIDKGRRRMAGVSFLFFFF